MQGNSSNEYTLLCYGSRLNIWITFSRRHIKLTILEQQGEVVLITWLHRTDVFNRLTNKQYNITIDCPQRA